MLDRAALRWLRPLGLAALVLCLLTFSGRYGGTLLAPMALATIQTAAQSVVEAVPLVASEVMHHFWDSGVSQLGGVGTFALQEAGC